MRIKETMGQQFTKLPDIIIEVEEIFTDDVA
jgi:hypothetical protein